MAQEDVHYQEPNEELGHLLESTYPLLKTFREKTPGTHKHSQAVASMVETVSLSLALDITLMKVCATYHDIGKICNPVFFTENQMEGENPHDTLDPWVSYQIVSRHVPDTVNILINNQDFPRKVIEIISQHHGNGIIKYFLDRAPNKPDPNTFRYHCAKPTSKESAVLMICDHVEAKSRSHFQAGKLNPADVIESTINNLIDDGQLDEVTMKLGDLKKIKLAIAKELEGSYQKRVQYPDDKLDLEDKR